MVAFVAPIVLNILARLKLISTGVQYSLDVLELAVDLLLAVTADHGRHALVLPLLHCDAVDHVATHREEHKPRHIHVEEFLEDPGPPDVDSLRASVDHELPIKPFSHAVCQWWRALLASLLIDVSLQIIRVKFWHFVDISRGFRVLQVLLP